MLLFEDQLIANFVWQLSGAGKTYDFELCFVFFAYKRIVDLIYMCYNI